MRLFLLFCWICTGAFAAAQERCLSAAYLQQQLLSKAGEKAISQADAMLQKKPAQKGIAEETVIRIPVVVHVVYNGSSQAVSDAQIKSGLAALNRDFRRKNADTVQTPQRFQKLAADVQLEFYLATADPQGRATTGIERKQTTRNGWLADDKIKFAAQGGLDAWDSKAYLNIWIGNLVGGSGYASVPGSAAPTDGIVIHYQAFGNSNTQGPFNLGRTAVHEVGHWLGLKHIWGDTQCGDDGVEDTPQQSFSTQGCPAGFRSSCNNNPDGDMYMNYMDYTNDACMNLFTRGQKQRMRAVLDEGGQRASLLHSKGLHQPWNTEALLPTPQTDIYPNPAGDQITVQAAGQQPGSSLLLLNSQGQAVRRELIKTSPQQFSLQGLKPGVYFLKGEGFQAKFIKL